MTIEKEYNDLLKRISKNLKKIREERGYTQEDMASFGFNYRYYQKIEAGHQNPTLLSLFKISKVLRVKISDIVD